jgi:hypothetical protein
LYANPDAVFRASEGGAATSAGTPELAAEVVGASNAGDALSDSEEAGSGVLPPGSQPIAAARVPTASMTIIACMHLFDLM